jgi:alkyldihydroxyacetonephosphate synthase
MPSLLATPARPLEEIVLAQSRLSPAERQSFAAILEPERVRDDAFERASHTRGKSYHDLIRLRAGDLSEPPDAVLYPRGAYEVEQILALASEMNVAVVPYGGGTSVVGGVSANAARFNRVVTLDLSGMNRILEIDSVTGAAVAEAGIGGAALEAALNEKSLTLGHYPQSFEYSTLGGWIAHRGTGQLSNRYGGPEDWLISAKIATPRGRLTTENFPASAAGPRVTDFIIGCEGIFGIITEARVRVRRVPEARAYQGYLFPDFASGITAVRQAMREDIPTAVLRLSDAGETRFYRALNGLGREPAFTERLSEAYLGFRGFDARAALLIAGFEGTRRLVPAARRAFHAIAARLGAVALGNGPGQHWLTERFKVPYLHDSMLDHSLGVDTLETASSWANLPRLYVAIRNALASAVRQHAPYPMAHGIAMCHLGHSYADGASLSFTYIFPRSFDNDVAQWQHIKKAATDAAVSHGGTLSHHHGVGEDHLPWITAEKSPLGIEVLRAVKQSLDPNGILNPGKLIPPD